MHKNQERSQDAECVSTCLISLRSVGGKDVTCLYSSSDPAHFLPPEYVSGRQQE